MRKRKVFVQELGTQIQDDLKPKCMLLPRWRAAEKGAGGAQRRRGHARHRHCEGSGEGAAMGLSIS